MWPRVCCDVFTVLLLQALIGAWAHGSGTWECENAIDPPKTPACVLWKELASLQRPDTCRSHEQRFLVFDLASYAHNGIGSILHEVIGSLAQAYHEDRTLIFGPVRNSMFHGVCSMEDSTGWDCLFEPISSCIFTDVKLADRHALLFSKDRESRENYRVVWARQARGNPLLYVPPPRMKGIDDKTLRRAEDPKVQTNSDRLLWITVLTAFVFRPVKSLQSYFATVESRIDWKSIRRPVVGVHIRRGNSCYFQTRKKCFSIVAYAEATRQFAPSQGSTVLLAAADISATEVSDFKRAGGWLDKEFIHHAAANCPKAGDDFTAWSEWEAVHLVPHSVYPALRDIWLLSDCDELVVTRSSHFSSLANNLRLARGKHRGPPAYLDLTQAVAGNTPLGFFHIANTQDDATVNRFERTRSRMKEGLNNFGDDDMLEDFSNVGIDISSPELINVPISLYHRAIAKWREVRRKGGPTRPHMPYVVDFRQEDFLGQDTGSLFDMANRLAHGASVTLAKLIKALACMVELCSRFASGDQADFFQRIATHLHSRILDALDRGERDKVEL